VETERGSRRQIPGKISKGIKRKKREEEEVLRGEEGGEIGKPSR